MRRIRYKDLSWPAGLNLERLVSLLPENVLREFLAANCHLDRRGRMIILPSLKCVRKILAHEIGKRIVSGETTWEDEKKNLKKDHQSLKAIKMTKWNIIRLYRQREKEIRKERNQ